MDLQNHPTFDHSTELSDSSSATNPLIACRALFLAALSTCLPSLICCFLFRSCSDVYLRCILTMATTGHASSKRSIAGNSSLAYPRFSHMTGGLRFSICVPLPLKFRARPYPDLESPSRYRTSHRQFRGYGSDTGVRRRERQSSTEMYLHHVILCTIPAHLVFNIETRPSGLPVRLWNFPLGLSSAATQNGGHRVVIRRSWQIALWCSARKAWRSRTGSCRGH